MAITELRYGKERNFKVEFIASIPEDKIILALNKSNKDLYLITDKVFNGITNYHMTPICSIKDNKDKRCYVTEQILFEDFLILALNYLSDLKNIENIDELKWR